ncbi:MAG: metabolite traffic protein EboE [Bacteroidota bacterium]
MLVNRTQHLTYCTNIHPGADWKATFNSLQHYVPKIKNKVSEGQPFGIGLRLSNTASEELSRDENLEKFKTWLANNELYVFTMNGFPYGNFHNEQVKDKVHAPDWTTNERVTYTKRLFDQLAFLLPNDISGGISTSPISYKHWHNSDESMDLAFKKGAKHLSEIIEHLYTIEKETGKYLHLDIEPEPDGLLENSDEVVRFFEDYLIPIAKDYMKEHLGLEGDVVQTLIYRHMTVCYDICHFSLAYEEPKKTLEKFKTAGIHIGKIQVSSALKIIFNDRERDEIWESLALFNESTYLHQVTEKVGDKVVTYNDLPVVLREKKKFSELRAHFHVPIFLERFDKLYATQDQILKVIDCLKSDTVSRHLEIETYTWEVLPDALKTDLSECIIREIQWLKSKL